MGRRLSYIFITIFLIAFLAGNVYAAAPQASSSETFYLTGKSHEELGHYSQALEIYHQALTLARQEQNSSRIAATLAGIGRVYLAQGQYEEARDAFQQALTFTPTPDDQLAIAAAFTTIGKVYTQWKEYDKALELYTQALTLNRRFGNQSGIAGVLAGLGSIYEARKQYDQAIDFYEQALALTRQLDEHAEITSLLTNLGDVYAATERHADAAEYYKEALTIERKVGEQTDIVELLSTLGYVSREGGQGQDAVKYAKQELDVAYQSGEDSEIATAFFNLGQGYEAQGQYVEAIEHYGRALQLWREEGEPSGISTALTSIAHLYVTCGQYAWADAYYAQALKVDRLLGERSDILDHLAELDKLYAAWKEVDKSPENMFRRYRQEIREARKVSEERLLLYEDFGLYQEALEEYQQDLQQFSRIADHDRIIDTIRLIARVYIKMGQYDNARTYQARELQMLRDMNASPADILYSFQFHASWYRKWGKYDLALGYFEQGLALVPQVDDQRVISVLYQELGVLYTEWGRYDQALQYYELALDAARKGNDPDQLYHAFEYIGNAYLTIANYPSAIENYQQALQLVRQNNETARMILMLDKIGEVYKTWGRYDAALDYYEQALDLARQQEKTTEIAATLLNIGNVYAIWEQYEHALTCYEQTFVLVYNPISLGQVLNQIGGLYRAWGKYEEAITSYQQALVFIRRVGSPADLAKTLYEISLTYKAAEDYPAAISHLIEGIEIIETILTTVTGETRRDYLSQQIKIYQALIACYVLMEDFDRAVWTIELIRGRILAEQLAGIRITSVDPLFLRQIQHTLPEDTAIIIYAENPEDDTFIRLVITRRQVSAATHPKAAFAQQAMKRYRAQIDAILEDEGLAEEAFARVIRYYRKLVINEWPIEALSQLLYNFLFLQSEEQIADKTTLIILPDGMLNFLPFETLMNAEGKYLVQTHNIIYAQSLGILEQLRARDYHQMPRYQILAFGGAVYEEPEEPFEGIVNEAQLRYMRRQVTEATTRGASLRQVYTSWLGISWSPLPGTLEEVNTIQKVVNDTEVVTGEEVQEFYVKLWSDNNTLSRYQVLHFATHGMVELTIPELSALVLSQFAIAKTEEEDNYLRIGEVAQLNLQADFVNLSACETGLGKIYGGQGIVGLTQSFLIAGANGLSVSLWEVADISTAQFMVYLYHFVNQGMGYPEAMTEVKRRFLAREFGDEWAHPYYWSPFVYYGKD